MPVSLSVRGPIGPPGEEGPTGPQGPPGSAATDGSAIFGQPDRFYAEVAVAMTFDGTGWVAKNDTDSRPHNVDRVTTDSQKIRVEHAEIDGIHVVGSPRADVGENLSSVGIRAITRPTSAYTDIILRQDRVISDVLTNPGNGSAWVKEKGGASFLTVSGLENTTSNFAAYVQGLANVAAHWRLSEASGTTLDDAIGANDGTVIGSGTTYGVTGGLLSDGADKALTTTGVSTNELTFPMAGITQAAFSVIWRGRLPSASGGFPFRDSTSANGYWVTSAAGSPDVIQYRMGDTASTYVTATPWSALADNNWHTLVMTKSGANVALYLDGVLIDSRTSAGSTALTNPWRVGRNGTSAVYVVATVSEFVTYSRALTAQEAKNAHDAAIADGKLYITHPSLGNTLASGISLTPLGPLQPELVLGSVTATGFAVKFRDAAGAYIADADTDLKVGVERKVVNRIIDPTAVSVDVKVVKEDTWPNVVEATAPVFWARLGEASGTSFNDEIGSNDGTSQATVTLGATGVIAGDSNKAVTFDGAQGKIAFGNTGLT